MSGDALLVGDLAGVRDNALGLAQAILSAHDAPPGPEDPRAALAKRLVPTPNQLHRLFRADAADRVGQAYAAAFDSPPWPAPKRGQSQAHVVACPAELFGTEHPLAQAFPGGYAGLAAHLEPGYVWVLIRFAAPGERQGMVYDGFAWLPTHGTSALDGTFVWLPKPWRLIS